MNKKNVAERAVKTFVEAFFSTLVPEIVVIGTGGLTDITTIWKTLTPFIIAALATAISATWNGLSNYLKKDTFDAVPTEEKDEESDSAEAEEEPENKVPEEK